ncbi:MAG TPA: peptidase M23 [Enterococcus sp.]|nr:peptidase M23 [Enterococcus sp.]
MKSGKVWARVKGKKLALAAVAVIGLNTFVPLLAQAESLDALDQQEQQVTKESETISAEVQLALTDVNQTYAKVEKIKSQISENETELADTNQQITDKEATIAKRKSVMADRLRNLQMSDATDSKLELLLNADSIQDFVNSVYAISVMQSSEKATVESLNKDVNQLETLKAKVEATQETLEANQAGLETQAATLHTKVKNLQTQLAEKQGVLQSIANSKVVETARLKVEAERAAKEKAEQEAAEKAAAEAAKKDQEKQAQAATKSTSEATIESKTSSSQTTNSSTSGTTQATSSSSSTSTSTTSSSSEQKTESSPTTNSTSTSSSNKVLYMQSTAYSYSETGYSITASGLDLRQNPMAVAVDTSVIPLGTMVEVEGYGIAIAADTGGAIKGNIIDVHFNTVEQCRQWGRRYNVKVTILG